MGILFLTRNETDFTGRVISFSSFIISLFFVFFLFANSDSLLQKILPKSNKWKDFIRHKVIYKTSMGIFFLGLILITIELLYFERVLRPGDFWKIYYPIGVILALVLIYTFPFISIKIYDSYERRFSIFWGILIGFPLLVVALSNMANRGLCSDFNIVKKFEVIDQKVRNKRKPSRDKYQLTIAIDQKKTKDLIVEAELYEVTKIGDKVTLVMNDGFLGFYIIQEVSKH